MFSNEIYIMRLKRVNERQVKELNNLLNILSAKKRKISLPAYKTFFNDPAVSCIALIYRGEIIGTGTLISVRTIRNFLGLIEDVVIHPKFQGRGLGEKLMLYLIDLAEKKKINKLKLTSRGERIAANRLYQKLGFKIRDTNVYSMEI